MNNTSNADVMGHRRLLFSVAFRMVGSAHDAEDMVQEAYSPWYGLDPHARSMIGSPRAWLVQVTSRLCLDHLRSARVRRESYVGDWLPEPLPTDYIAANFGGGPTPGDPVHDVTLDESVSTALLVLLEEVTPAERVTFILHDVFGVPFREISEIVGRTPAACRQLAVSARRHVHSGHRSRASSDLGAHSAVVSAFKRACSNGDLRDLIASLASDVTVRVDGGGRVRAALRPLVGPDKVARFLVGVFTKQKSAQLVEQSINGKNGMLVVVQDRIVGAYSFDVVNSKISRIWIVVNPDKLGFWNM